LHNKKTPLIDYIEQPVRNSIIGAMEDAASFRLKVAEVLDLT